MVWPLLLGLGLMAGNSYVKQARAAEQEAGDRTQLQGLLGSPAEMWGPPDPGTGRLAALPGTGTGLLADPTNPQAQAQFAAGLMQMPRMREAGVTLLNQMMNRGQQGEQFNMSQAQQDRQWQGGQARQAEQFDRSLAQSNQHWQGGQDRQAQQWQAQHQLALAEEARQQQAHALQQQQRRQALAQGAAGAPGAAGDALPKLSPGWGYTQGADGQAVAMPVPGTVPYQEAITRRDSLASAISNVERIMDISFGEEKTVNGTKVRAGGKGVEWGGAASGELSSNYSRLIESLGQLANAGVLQVGDVERLQKSLPDMSALSSHIGLNSTNKAAYEAVRKQFREKLKGHYAATPWLRPPPPPGFVVQ